MGQHRRLNFLILLFTNLATKGAWFAALLLLMGYLGAETFGTFAALWALGGLAAGFADFGSGQVLLRDAARSPALARPISMQVLALQVGSSLIALAFLSMAAYFLLPLHGVEKEDSWTFITLSLATMLLDRLNALFTVFSQLAGKYRRFSMYRSGYFLLLLVALWGVIELDGGAPLVVQVYFLLTVLFTLLAGFETWRQLPPTRPGSYSGSLYALIRQSVWFLGNTGLSITYGRLEVVLLGVFGFTAMAGVYHLSYQVMLLLYSVSGIFFTVIYPRLYAHRADTQALHEDFLDTFRWLSLFTWASSPVLLIYTGDMLRLLGVEADAHHVEIARWLAGIVLLLPLAAILDFLPALNQAKQRVYADIVGLALTAVLSLVFILADAPAAVAVAAWIGYAATILAAYFISAGKQLIHIKDVIRETLGFVWRAGLALLFVTALPLQWWQASMIYPLTFALILMMSKEPTALKLVYILSRKTGTKEQLK